MKATLFAFLFVILAASGCRKADPPRYTLSQIDSMVGIVKPGMSLDEVHEQCGIPTGRSGTDAAGYVVYQTHDGTVMLYVIYLNKRVSRIEVTGREP